MKKYVSIVLVFAIVLTMTVFFSGCADNDYPVQIANITIDKEPENVVVLDDASADIMSYIGFDDKWAGRSEEVNQEWLKIVSNVGSAADPDVNKIIDAGADLVIANDQLDSDKKDELTTAGIKVITMSSVKSEKQLEVNYDTIGRILGGNETGKRMGVEAFRTLKKEMETIQSVADSSKTTDVPDTICYLYIKENKLRMMSSSTYGNMLLTYTGAVNVAVHIDNDIVDANTLKIANPNYILYADDATYQYVSKHLVLRTLNAIKTKKVCKISMEEMSRQGQTAINTLRKIVYFMYPNLDPDKNATPEQAATTVAQSSVQQTTVASTTAASSTAKQQSAASTTAPASVSVASKYKITITNKLALKPGDENANVKAMQKRLYDLGYITDAENVTGYYGEMSETAVSDFQKKNQLNATGVANNATLLIMFDSKAVKA